MVSPAPNRPRPGLGRLRELARRTLLRRIWLPTLVYEAMPWLYLGTGGGALLGGLYLPDNSWLWPYLGLLAVACLQAAYAVAAARQRRRAAAKGVDAVVDGLGN